MEALQLQLQGHTFSLRPLSQYQPDTDKIKRNLIQKGVNPTPKIIHTLRKKQIQKHNRKLNRQAQQSPPLSNSQKQTLVEEQDFQELKHEYKQFTKALEANEEESEGLGFPLVGKPWEGIQKVEFLERTKVNKEYRGEKLKRESLNELGEMFRQRNMDDLKWLFDDDLEINELLGDESSYGVGKHTRKRSEAQVIRFLVDRLCEREVVTKDWKVSRLMKLSGLPFTESQLMMVVGMLGDKGCWKQALSVVQWVYNSKDHRKYQSR